MEAKLFWPNRKMQPRYRKLYSVLNLSISAAHPSIGYFASAINRVMIGAW
jgi:hypothetical protein